MSCWVVPTIAAEIWGVSVDHILQRVGDGSLSHRTDEGFMFVDVIPLARDETIAFDHKPAQEEHPATFTPLSQGEIEALREHDNGPDDHPTDAPGEADPEPVAEDIEYESSVILGDWRAARMRVGRTRVPPARQLAA